MGKLDDMRAAVAKGLAKKSQGKSVSPPAATPAEAGSGKKPSKIVKELPAKVKHSCGHSRSVVEIENSHCPTCIRKNWKKRAEHFRKWKNANLSKCRRGRLPDGSSFAATYDAESQTWTGSLIVQGVEYTATCGAVFRLLDTLDGLYHGEPLPESVDGVQSTHSQESLDL